MVANNCSQALDDDGSSLSTSAEMLAASLDAALDGHAAPAFLVDHQGEVLRANAAGADLFEYASERWSVELRARVDRPGDGARRVEVEGRPACWLLVLTDVRLGVGERLFTARRLWSLSDKLTRVLELVVEGESNKTIAADLGVAAVTAEAHVKTLTRRAGVTTRPELVARFWTMRASGG